MCSFGGRALLDAHYATARTCSLELTPSCASELHASRKCAPAEDARAPRHAMCSSGGRALLDEHSTAPRGVLLGARP